MSDSEFSSEEDRDYVPGENLSSDSESDRISRENFKSNRDPEKKDSWNLTRRIRIDENEISTTEDNETAGEKEEAALKQQRLDTAKKAKEEELWAAFKQDTGIAALMSSKATSSLKPSSSSTNKVSVMKTYDFAGEPVVVTETLSENSRDVKRGTKDGRKEANIIAKPTVTSVVTGGFKRPGGGLNSVLGQMTKKPKMSTLEKSKMDWDSFKAEEGVEDELRNYNKDGYLEKQAFLHRVDEREFDLERDVRHASRRR